MAKRKVKRPIVSSNLFPVVGIGASAGGLEAFKQLIKAIPEHSGMAYVLVQHLDPTHQSLLPDLLQKVTPIPVIEISDDIQVKPDHIYIIPSNRMLLANDGVLELSPRPPRSGGMTNLPIDVFFTSLAEVHQAHSIGVVLSGSASDGTLGLKAIREHGGLTFAQDENSATYTGMPQSAQQAGVVDFILPPERIPLKIIELLENDAEKFPGMGNVGDEENVLREIIALLRKRRGTDFTFYKQSTIKRRIGLRMTLSGKETAAEYLQLLQDHPAELDQLYQSLLIPVTSFFRDERTFDHLCSAVFPAIIKHKKNGEPIRIWVAGCSTGQEVYSIAICIKEFLGDQPHNVQVFATDISEPAIVKARSGRYSKDEVQGLSPQKLETFFSSLNGEYQVSKSIREMCIFARHNFLSDPPFGRMDLISCRNVLIYMEPYLQQKALTSFHFALTEAGFLLLGNAESIKSASDIFNVYDSSEKIFIRKNTNVKLLLPRSQAEDRGLQGKLNQVAESYPHSFQKSTDDLILSRLNPAGVVVNEAMDIVYFRGNTGLYLQPSEGKPSHNLSRMAKTGLAFELRSLLHKARKDGKAVMKEGIPLAENGGYRHVTLEVIPMPNMAEPHFLILFQESASKERPRLGKARLGQKSGQQEYQLRIEQLEQELVQTREDMRAITEHQESVNTDLQGANEELQSSSEELQSLNDELETSKEELQNSNEELQVVNQALTSLNHQLVQARDYAEAIIATVGEPLVVLDNQLRIRTANKAFYSLFQLDAYRTEGKLIYDIGDKEWDIPELHSLLERVIPEKKKLTNYEVALHFPLIGDRVMSLSASQIISEEQDRLLLLSIDDITETVLFNRKEKEFQQQLEKEIQARTSELKLANEELQQKNQEIALSMYNKRFLHDFSDRFSTNQVHLEFFNSVVLYIADLVKLDYVLIGKLEDTKDAGLMISTIAMTAHGKLTANTSYSLADGPCEEVIRGKLYNYPAGCQEIFPKSDTLKKYKVEGYIGFPLFSPSGNAIGLISVMHEKPIADAETVASILKIVAKRTEIELERITIEEQLLINNKKLEDKNDDLVKLNMELESFTQISSHDLQEPLRKIQIFTNKILAGEAEQLSEKGQEYFSRIRRASERMQTLLEDLLAYSRTNVFERVFEEVNLDQILEDTLQELAEVIKEKHALIEAEKLCSSKINASQFRQVMINLIGNALKFSKKGVAPHIRVESEVISAAMLKEAEPRLTASRLSTWTEYCHIRITDNGIGFESKYNEQIFEVFERLHGRDEYPGTGIGLAIVRRIITNHDGFIFAKSEVNEGSSFDIYIPHDR